MGITSVTAETSQTSAILTSGADMELWKNIYLDSNLGVAAIVATRDETMAGIQKRRTGVDCRPSHLPIVLSKSTDQEVGKTKDYIALQQMGITKCHWCHKCYVRLWYWTPNDETYRKRCSLAKGDVRDYLQHEKKNVRSVRKDLIV
ncbi:hypothetical protein F2Q70_00006236 [Brassica cretica]|uniref:Uncharacterized protein n=1 Tax=Brassica cretica TaxID=69181 RepID=A0A8S9IPM8_BRACR|nr:hypothetical protein F2Q70_00006236 [Brassica cretica]